MKKVIFLIALFAIIGILIYLVFNLFGSRRETAIIVLTLQKHDSLNYDKVLYKNIEEEIKKIDNRKVTIYFYKQDGYAHGIEIKQKSGITDKNFIFKKIDTLFASVSHYFDNELNSVKLYNKFEAFLTKINQLKKEDKEIIAIIAGAFPYPTCTNNKTIKNIISSFDNYLKGFDINQISFILNVCSNSDRPEQNLFDHLKKKYIIIDKNIILPFPPCISINDPIEDRGITKKSSACVINFLISSSVDNNEIIKITNKVDSLTKLFDTLNIKILDTDNAREYNLVGDQKIILKEQIKDILISSSQSSLNRLKFMFDNTFTSIEKSDNKYGYLFIVGSIPQEVRRIYTFRGPKKTKPYIFLMLKPDNFQTIFQNVIQEYYEFETIR